MAEKEKDDLANALQRLAAGEAPSAPDGVPSEQVPLTPPKPNRPATPGGAPAPGLPPGATKKKPSSTARAVTPPPRQTSHQVPRSIAPQRPSVPKPNRPTEPSISQPPAPPRAATPTAPVAQSGSEDISSSLANVIDDGDAVIVPAPTPDVLAHRPAPKRIKRDPIYTKLSFRQTLIPILLTMGVALPGCAVWWLFLDPDSPLKSATVWFPITLAVIGLVLLALGVMNMLFVKHYLQQQSQK
jgi:hypothetical protein